MLLCPDRGQRRAYVLGDVLGLSSAMRHGLLPEEGLLQ
jgi:hypothetical protein